MWRSLLTACLGTMAALCTGCATGPLVDNPVLLRPTEEGCIENPVYIPLGPASYAAVFEKVLDVMDDSFEIAYANRYDGRIETFPRVAPGFEQPWKSGSPNCRERLLATLQSLRHRALVLIQPADDGGFFVDVKVLKELEDLSRPIRATAGEAAFRADNTVERQFDVVDPIVLESNWIPLGRDIAFEQQILEQLKKCM